MLVLVLGLGANEGSQHRCVRARTLKSVRVRVCVAVRVRVRITVGISFRIRVGVRARVGGERGFLTPLRACSYSGERSDQGQD